jgi:hypothetical protein
VRKRRQQIQRAIDDWWRACLRAAAVGAELERKLQVAGIAAVNLCQLTVGRLSRCSFRWLAVRPNA